MAIVALEKLTLSAVVWEFLQALGKLSGLKVTFLWTLGHQGIWGNEEADTLARYGANKDPVGQVTGVTFTAGKEGIRGYLQQEHPTGWIATSWLPPVQDALESLPSRASELLALSRLRLKLAVWLLTGHTTLKARVKYLIL